MYRLVISLLCLCATAFQAAFAAPVTVMSDDLPDQLRTQIETALADEDAPQSAFEARRQARRAAETVRAVLNAEGYYDPEIDFAVEPGPDFKPLVRVTSGRPFTISDVKVLYPDSEPLSADAIAVADAHGIAVGDRAKSNGVISGEGEILKALRRLGYPDARALDRVVRGDRANAKIAVSYQIAPGPRVRFGDLVFDNKGRTQNTYLRKISSVEIGAIYDPEVLAIFNARLNENRLYSLATAQLADTGRVDPETGDEIRDVVVRLEDRPRHTLRLGGSFSTAEGVSVRAGWTRRNMTGRGDTLDATLEIGTLQRDATLIWRQPNRFAYGYGLTLNVSFEDETTDAFDRRALVAGGRLSITDNPKRVINLGGEVEITQEEDALGSRDFRVVSGLASIRLDHANSALNATEGWRADVSVSPTYAFGDTWAPYVRALGQLSAFQPVLSDAKLVLAGRLRIGAVIGADTVNLPVSDRFFAGGGGSVRGYEFQGIGPRDAATNTPVGGQSLIDGSFELRYRLRGQLGLVGFMDAGSVGTEATPGFDDMRYGVGLGVRYDTAVGPIRFDVATPLERRDGEDPVQVYISIGQAF